MDPYKQLKKNLLGNQDKYFQLALLKMNPEDINKVCDTLTKYLNSNQNVLNFNGLSKVPAKIRNAMISPDNRLLA